MKPKFGITCEPFEFRGVQISSSAISQITTGRVIEPRSLEIVTRSPSITPSFVAQFALMCAAAVRAVPAKFASPSCKVPRSRSKRQVLRFNLSPALCFAGVETFVNYAFAPSHSPREEISRAVAATVGRLIGAFISSASMESIRTSLRESDSSIPFSKLRPRPCQSR